MRKAARTVNKTPEQEKKRYETSERTAGKEKIVMRQRKKQCKFMILTAIMLVAAVLWLFRTLAAIFAEPIYTASAHEISMISGSIELPEEKTEIAPVQLEYVMETPGELQEEDYWNSLELLAICVEAEAGNQGLEGKRLVVDVILNRVDDKSGEWPDSIPEVIMQENHFTSYWDSGMERVVEPSEETFKAVQMELEERSYPGIYYFREGTWSDYGTPWKKVGDHYFSLK